MAGGFVWISHFLLFELTTFYCISSLWSRKLQSQLVHMAILSDIRPDLCPDISLSIQEHVEATHIKWMWQCRFDKKIAAQVSKETGLPFVTAPNKFEALVIACQACFSFKSTRFWHRIKSQVLWQRAFLVWLHGKMNRWWTPSGWVYGATGSAWCFCGV